jgi:hypothetical protein
MNPCSILISNFQGHEALELCVESILKRTEHDYRITVFDSTGKGSGDRKYLDKAEREGRINLLAVESPASHGQAITAMLKECRGGFACLLDNDVEILMGDWLSVLMARITSYRDAGVARFISARAHHANLFAPVFWSACMLLNLALYRKIMGDDIWSQMQIRFENYPHRWIFDGIERPQNFSGIVYCDTEWRFTEKLLFENKEGFIVQELPSAFLDDSIRHYGGMSRNWRQPEVIEDRWNEIRKNLRKLREESR